MDSPRPDVILADACLTTAGRGARILLSGLLALAVLTGVATPASGASGTQRAAASLPGPRFLHTGFADSFAFQGTSPSVATQWLARAQGIGSSSVRLAALWNAIAPAAPTRTFNAADPTDPGYDWSALDGQIEAATLHGQRVVLMLFGAPPWALGRNAPAAAPPGTWRPNPSALGAFAHAVAQRYSGRFPDPLHPYQNLPRVSYFQAWNEPNLRFDLSPQWTRDRRGKWTPASPAFYRRMLNAVYANVKSVQPDAYVLAAGTAPYGDPPGVDRMRPVAFWRELLCLHGPRLRREYCPDPAHFDALDHHPYALNPTMHAFSPDSAGVPDIGRLTAILRVAERTGRVLPAGPKRIWVTEIAWSSNPPDPTAITAALQARYLALTFFQLWRQGVSHIFWLLIRDYPYKSLTGSGVYFADGRQKPSAQAFHLPFVALRRGRRSLTLWGHAPHAGVVEIERRTGHRWVPLIHLTTTTGGVFYTQRRLGSHLVLRAQIGNVTSLPWRTR